MVAVEVEKNMYRGVIEDINCNTIDEHLTKSYQCWLIDYGLLVETLNVYKLPASIRKIPPLSIQVCLKNIAYVQQVT